MRRKHLLLFWIQSICGWKTHLVFLPSKLYQSAVRWSDLRLYPYNLKVSRTFSFKHTPSFCNIHLVLRKRGASTTSCSLLTASLGSWPSPGTMWWVTLWQTLPEKTPAQGAHANSTQRRPQRGFEQQCWPLHHSRLALVLGIYPPACYPALPVLHAASGVSTHCLNTPVPGNHQQTVIEEQITGGGRGGISDLL